MDGWIWKWLNDGMTTGPQNANRFYVCQDSWGDKRVAKMSLSPATYSSCLMLLWCVPWSPNNYSSVFSKGKHARTFPSSAPPFNWFHSVQTVDLLTLSWRVRLQLYSFSHYTMLVTTGEGQCKDQWLNLELCSVAWLTFATMLQQSATDMLASSQYHCPSSPLITSGS